MRLLTNLLPHGIAVVGTTITLVSGWIKILVVFSINSYYFKSLDFLTSNHQFGLLKPGTSPPCTDEECIGNINDTLGLGPLVFLGN